MSNELNEIKDIVAQLQQLHLQESELLLRLGQLSQVNTSVNITCELAVGDLVRIKNPRPLQAGKGTITKINIATNRVTIQSKNGSKIIRAPSNIEPIF